MKIVYYKNTQPTQKQLDSIIETFLNKINTEVLPNKLKLSFHKFFKEKEYTYFVFFYGTQPTRRANDDGFIKDLLHIKKFYFMRNCLIVKVKSPLINLKRLPRLVYKISNHYEFKHFTSELNNTYING